MVSPLLNLQVSNTISSQTSLNNTYLNLYTKFIFYLCCPGPCWASARPSTPLPSAPWVCFPVVPTSLLNLLHFPCLSFLLPFGMARLPPAGMSLLFFLPPPPQKVPPVSLWPAIGWWQLSFPIRANWGQASFSLHAGHSKKALG